MIDYIYGRFAESAPGWVVLENNGIGYRIEVPINISLPKDHHESVCLYTRLVVREDGMTLFGFSNSDQRNLFNLITGVSGIGPRMALNVLGMMPVSNFYIAILNEDYKALCLIPGVGRKTAQRMVLELKEKIPTGAISSESGVPSEFPMGTGSSMEEALKALCSLGYSQAEATHVLSDLRPDKEDDATTEEILKMALQKINSSKTGRG